MGKLIITRFSSTHTIDTHKHTDMRACTQAHTHAHTHTRTHTKTNDKVLYKKKSILCYHVCAQERLTILPPDGDSLLNGETTALVVHNKDVDSLSRGKSDVVSEASDRYVTHNCFKLRPKTESEPTVRPQVPYTPVDNT